MHRNFPSGKRIVYLLAACMLAFAPLSARADNKEALVKAAFMYNFVKFVAWPQDTPENRKSIDICMLGDGEMASAAGEVFRAASTPEMQLHLLEVKSWQEAVSRCRMLYIGHAAAGRLSEILSGLKTVPVLTVSDIPGFARSGGMIGFVLDDNKIKLVVNLRAANVAGLQIDAQLLEIALKVIKG